jgi:hypothetical protein
VQRIVFQKSSAFQIPVHAGMMIFQIPSHAVTHLGLIPACKILKRVWFHEFQMLIFPKRYIRFSR